MKYVSSQIAVCWFWLWKMPYLFAVTTKKRVHDSALLILIVSTGCLYLFSIQAIQAIQAFQAFLGLRECIPPFHLVGFIFTYNRPWDSVILTSSFGLDQLAQIFSFYGPGELNQLVEIWQLEKSSKAAGKELCFFGEKKALGRLTALEPIFTLARFGLDFVSITANRNVLFLPTWIFYVVTATSSKWRFQ